MAMVCPEEYVRSSGSHRTGWKGTLAALLVVAAFVAVVVAPAPPAAADPVVVDVMAGATALGTSVAYPAVAAGANGNFHAVARDASFGGARITYLRSADGGRTWVRQAILSGTIGATRPSIAADGDHIAVTFVGAWVDGAGVHGEAPYLTTSDDGGASWTPARRLGTWATDVDVAVDGDRVWVIWGGTGGLRGTDDGGATFFVSEELTGVTRAAIAAGDGLVSVAYLDGAGDTLLAVGQGTAVGAFHQVDTAVLQDVAAADGLAYVLVASGGDLSVLATSPGGNPSRVQVPAAYGGALGGGVSTTLWADLAAGRGTLAVATCVSGTVYVTESTEWPTFGEPTAVTTFDDADAQPCRAVISAPAAGSEIEPRFDWSVAPHYTDTDGDGLAEPANLTGTAVDNVLVGANARLEVTLNGCASLPAGGGGSIVRYLWSVDGDLVADLDHCEGPTIEVQSGERPTVRLDVRGDDGTRAITSREIAPRDLVVVSLGDSVASGEGSPLRRRIDPGGVAWSDASCHRSPYAGPALAAQQLENSDPHTSVTFVQLACSGAAVVDTFEDPSQTKQPGDPDDPVTGGVADQYAGVAHADTCATGGPCPTLRPSQIDQMQHLLGARAADAVLVSVGANDVRFSDIVQSCIVNVVSRCDTDVAKQANAQRMADLPRRYETLAVKLHDLGVEAGRVYLTEYFDPTGDRYGVTNLRCIPTGEVLDDVDISAFGLVTDDEASWARTDLVGGLNRAVHTAAATFGWNVVDGIADEFARHGYCSTDPWIVRISESLARQGDLSGPFHPNRAGQEVYGDAIAAHLSPLVQTSPTEPTAEPPTGAAAVGDLVVMAGTVWAAEPELRSVALTTTGGRPHVGAVRVLQHGAGWGAVAVGGESSVGVWAGEHGAFGAQLGSRPNVAVRDVHLVQAATDNSRLVTNRKTIVLADLWSSVDGALTTSVSTSVVARDEAGNDTEVVAPRTEDVTLHPGRNEIQLPLLDTFDAPHDTVLIATVSVTDPVGASDEDSADNERSTLPGDFVPTIATRPVKVAVVALDFGGGTVSCATMATAANTWVAWAQQLLPVPEGGLQADLSCSPDMLAPSASAAGVAQALGELDLLARVAGLDSVVGVVPDGWLGQALGDASVGRAGVTGRSILLEATAPATALAHELGHNFGLDHSDGRHAAGVWVSRSRLVDGTDFMAPSYDGISRHWVSGETWDLLTGSIHVGSERTPPQGGGTAYWVRGMMPVAGDSIFLDPFLDDGDIPTLPPEGSDTSRLVVVPVAGDGDPVGPPVAIGLEPDLSLDGSGDSPMRFAQRVVAAPGTAAFRFLLDGAVVAERNLGTAPSISVSSPSDGTVLGRNDTIDVQWTVDDPDTALGEPPPSIALLVSDDAGLDWRPLATGLTGTSVSLPVPRDLGGPAIRVRVVAMDGVHVRWADSPTFEIASVASGQEDRLVFVAGDADVFEGERTQIGTMRPDGTDVRFLSLPTDVTDGNGTELFARYASPVWGPDGERIYFASLANPDINCPVVESVRADGTDRRREITPGGEHSTECSRMRSSMWNTTEPCLSMTPDGRRLLVGTMIYEQGAGGWTPVGTLGDPSFTGAPEWFGILPFAANIAVQSWGNQCPTLSPDGRHVAVVKDVLGTRSDLPVDDAHPAGWSGSVLAVVVVPVSPGWPTESPFVRSAQVVTAWNEDLYRDTAGPDVRKLGVGWLSDTELLVARGTPGWTNTALERIDLTSLSREDPYPLHPATATPVSTLSLPSSDARLRDPKPTPGGALFGDVDCGVYIGDQQAVATFRSTDIPGEARCFREFDLGRTTIGSSDRLIAIDPDLAVVPDPEGPEVVTVDEGEPAPGAGTGTTRPRPTQVLPDSVTIEPGHMLEVVLVNELGTPARYEVEPEPSIRPTAGTLTVFGDVDPSGLVSTTGPLLIGVDEWTTWSTGTAQLRVRVAGANEFETLDVRIAIPPVPVAVDDEVTVRTGVETVLPASVLLANDVPSEPGADLELVQVVGYDGGEAFLDPDGDVHVAADADGTGTFVYVVGEPGSMALAVGSVTVTASSDTPPITNPPITNPPVTNPPITNPPVNLAVVPAPATTLPGPVTPWSGQLPVTGGDQGGVATVAIWLCLGGLVLVIIASRRRRGPTTS